MDDKDRDTMKVAMPWNLNWLAIGRWQWHRRVVEEGMRWRKRVRERDRGKGFEYSQYNDFRATITTFYL